MLVSVASGRLAASVGRTGKETALAGRRPAWLDAGGKRLDNVSSFLLGADPWVTARVCPRSGVTFSRNICSDADHEIVSTSAPPIAAKTYEAVAAIAMAARSL